MCKSYRYVLLVVILVILALQMAAADYWDINAVVYPAFPTQTGPIGCPILVAYTAIDLDYDQYNQEHHDTLFITPGDIIQLSGNSVSLVFDTAMDDEEIEFMVDDYQDGLYQDDTPVIFDGHVTVVAPLDIEGPASWCTDACPEFTAETNPFGHETMLHWYYKRADVEDEDYHSIGSNSPCEISLSPGKYMLAVTTWDATVYPDNWQYAKTKVVNVYGLPPDCPKPKTGDPDNPGGGCDSGNCGGGESSPVDPNVKITVYKCEACHDDENYYWQCKWCNKCKNLQESDWVNDVAFLGDGFKIERDGNEGSWTYTITDGFGNVYSFDSASFGSEKDYAEAPLLTETDADGNETEYTWDSGKIDYVTIKAPDTAQTVLQTWDYAYDVYNGDNRQIVTAPDSSKTKTTYVTNYSTDPWAVGKTKSVINEDADSNVISGVIYTYYTDAPEAGLLESIYNVKSGATVTYTYTLDSNGKITSRTETQEFPQTEAPDVVTEYEYGLTTNTITRKCLADSNKDQITEYRYFTEDDKQTYLFEVTDPGNGTGNGITTYATYVSSNTTIEQDMEEDDQLDYSGDYRITSDPDLLGKVFKITDPLGRKTLYEYNATTGAITKVEYREADNDPIATEEYSYYTVQSTPTSFVKVKKDTRDTYTYYDRSPGNLNQVIAEKVVLGADIPPEVEDPLNDDEYWNNDVQEIKRYEYYISSTDVQKGLVYKEIIPTVVGDPGEEEGIKTEYDYLDENEDLQPGPTSTTRSYWNGSAYVQATVDSTTYNTMGDVTSSTDSNSRSITYEKEYIHDQYEDGFLETTTYATNVFTQTQNGCCGVEWQRDENGNKTRYEYDEGGRVIKTWTDIQGDESPTKPLIKYDYDCFGNIWKTSTYEDSNSSGRVTEYTYDKMNRVTKIDYPSPLGDEEFQYDLAGNLIGKMEMGMSLHMSTMI